MISRFPTGGAGRGGGGEYFAKVAAVMVIGVGWNRQAMVAAILPPESTGVSEEGE
jgi:hypothetical protein